MKSFLAKIGLAGRPWLTAMVAVGLLMFISVVGWSATRFHRTTICLSCHEIFVDQAEYAPKGDLSASLEDYKPAKAIEPKLFHVSVGCAECHAYPYEEYKESPHYFSERGVRPGCIGCHEPHSSRQLLAWKFFYVNEGSLGESPFHAISNSLRDIPAWEELRETLAKRVRRDMVADQSAMCKNCHKPKSEWFNKLESHKTNPDNKTCVQCHYNLVHKSVKWHEDTLTEKK